MGKNLDKLIDVVATLRAPGGCPWDREQTHKSMLSDFLDEVYEFFEAVDDNDSYGMREELGDILLQVVFHSTIANEESKFDFEDVAGDILDKMIRRHPHVFGDETADSTEEVLANWEQIKKSEKGKEDRKYITDGVPKPLPSLFRAEKIQKKVSRFGFDWGDVAPALDKVEEEFAEFRSAIENGDSENAFEELGDILFSLVNVSRYQKISAEDALRHSVNKFIKRFNYIEDSFDCDSDKIKEATLEELDKLWDKSKKEGL
jgi:tetrapyrrole methylase family protein/MazG family protein